MKRKYRLLADNLGSVKRWRVLDAVPVALFFYLIYQGYEGVDSETGVMLIIALCVSTMLCNPFGLLSWALPPASRYCISGGVTMVYGVFLIATNEPDINAYPLVVSGGVGALLLFLGVRFRPRWLETWRHREERRRYQLSIFQCETVDRTIGQLKAKSQTAAVDAWNEYGNAQCRALLHQWADIEITEDEIDHVCYPVWLLAHGSAFTDRAEITQKYEEKIEKLETENKKQKDQLINNALHGENYYQKEKELTEFFDEEKQVLKGQIDGLTRYSNQLKEKVESLESERDYLRNMVDALTAEPDIEALEVSGNVVRMFPRPEPESEPETLEDVPDVTTQADEPAPEPEKTPTITIAGVAVPVDLKSTQLRDLRILEYHEQDPKAHSSQNCADFFGLNSRKTADSALGRARKLREQLLRAEQEERAVNA